MTLTTENNSKEYTANGVTLVFAYDFLVNDEDDLKVYLDGVLQSSGYTVDGIGVATGGNVTFSVAPGDQVRVSIYREVEMTQEVDYIPYDPFPAETHESALDKLTMLIQQVFEITSRAITAPIGSDPEVDYSLPLYDAGKGIMWDDATKTLVNSDDDLNGITTAAAASASAASASASAAASSAASALSSKNAAQTAETNAETAETGALAAQLAAESAKTAAEAAQSDAEAAQAAAETAETNAETAETNAAASAASALSSKNAAATSETNAATSESNASDSEDAAAASAALAATYAVQKFVSTSAPTSGDGSNGDLWFQYS